MAATAPACHARQRVWCVLSTLFLDTDVTEMRETLARELAASPFEVEELESILIHEVFPVCWWNLISVAGVWTGFDEAWLIEAIRRRKGPLTRAWAHVAGRFVVRRDADWCAVRAAIARQRQPDRHGETT